MKNPSGIFFCFLGVIFLSISACSTNSPVLSTPTASAAPQVSSSVVEVTPSSPSPTAGPANASVWISPDIPQWLTDQIFANHTIQTAAEKDKSACALELNNQNQVASWVFTLVAPFDTTTDNISLQAINNKWKDHSSDFPAASILVDQDSYTLLTSVLGKSDPDSVKVLPQAQILEQAWKTKDTWAIIPFDNLVPEWKVLSIDNNSPVDKQFDPQKYGLTIPISLSCTVPDDSSKYTTGKVTNRDTHFMTTLTLTGVTAMVRGTAYAMETKGIDYPAMDILPILKDTDYLHISNEIPYWPKCPPPFQNPGEVKLEFCSNPKYNQLLQDIGTNIMDLSGDHFNDWGADATTYTLDMYKKLGWPYFGGGYNREDARKALLIEHNGNKLAFLGCNAKPPGYGTASDTRPGAVHCNFDDMDARIKAVKAQGYIPIVTFQHLEYYTYKINPALQVDFRNVADAGAAIVSGDQAHQPQAIEFYNGSFLHYGLGNLFFDQFKEGFPERQAFIDRYVFYKGKYINTQLITIMFTDLAHSRPMTSDERLDLLNTIFKVSLWPFSN